MSFPANFVWGASTSSYQIEGAWNEDGKGASIWDVFSQQPGRIWEGSNGNVACDHYHRRKADVDLMAEIGLNAYRFSVAWPRIFSARHGHGQPGRARFLRQACRRPAREEHRAVGDAVPLGLSARALSRGGWLNPESPRWFERYTEAVVDRLSDRVQHWMSINELACCVGLGHLTRRSFARLEAEPGGGAADWSSLPEVLQIGHHCLLAHGRAVQAIRGHAKRPATIGWSPVGFACYPATETRENIEAARKATLGVFPNAVWNNRWWGDAALLGHYPDEGLKVYGDAVPKFKSSDFDIIHQPVDFYGCNIYSGVCIKAGPTGDPVQQPFPPGFPQTFAFWKKTPESLYWGPRFLSEHYKLPIVVTENGMSNCDWVSVDGRVHDATRIEFMNSYLLQLRRAIHDGVDVRGYFAWSLMDNFEWQDGFKQRYGLIHVDYTTQQRILKIPPCGIAISSTPTARHSRTSRPARRRNFRTS